MNKIYILTDGDYSDYYIIGVYSSEENATIAKKLLGGGIEEYELDEYVKDKRFPFEIYFDKDRNIKSIHISIGHERREYNKFYKMGFKYDELRCYVLAEDKEHARKIAGDLLAQYIANNHD